MDKQRFNLVYQYEQYLKRVGLNEQRMSPAQRTETKRAFYGACGQLLVLLRDDVGELEESEAIQIMDDLFKQVGNFWANECLQVN